MKMKLAVILGVSHMTLGIILKGINARYFYKPLDFYFEFIPQLVLLTVTFGYMNVLIITKWLTPYNNTADAPSIIAIMIDMALTGGGIRETPLIGNRVAHGIVNILLLVCAFISIPTMLLVKPILITQEIKKKENSKSPGAIELGLCTFKKRKMSGNIEEEKSGSDDESDSLIVRKPIEVRKRFVNDIEDRRDQIYNPRDDPYSYNSQEKPDEAREKLVAATNCYKQNESHDLQEVWIHQLIETIEFVLGTISNTASYLRLWALSLAHSQLAAVFYDKLIKSSVETGNWSMLFFTMPFFLSANFFILVCMDAMECFLHTLRLHWVEFQNKFYKGSGYRFLTFSLVESTGFIKETE